MPCLKLLIAFAGCCVLAAAPGIPAPGEPVEGAPVFFARDVLPGWTLASPHYKISPIVEVEEFEFVFDIAARHGDYRARGLGELKRCLREIEAIARLGDVSQSRAFASSLSSSLSNPLVTTFGVARRPISSVTGLPGGIGRYLGGKWYQVKRGSEDALDKWRAFRAPDEEEEERVVTEEPADAASAPQRIGRSADKLSKRHLGHDGAKRKWARRLGVDPYSSNPALQEALGRIAWASSLGDFAGDFAMPGSEVFSYAGKAQELVWERPPHQLEREIIQRLANCGLAEQWIEAFIETETYSLTEKVALSLAMKELGATGNLALLVETLLEAETGRDAAVLIRTVELFAQYCGEVCPLASLRRVRGMLVGTSQKGYDVVPIAADYVHWTPLLYEALLAEGFVSDKREVWVAGEVSPVARLRLSHHGWEVFDQRERRD